MTAAGDSGEHDEAAAGAGAPLRRVRLGARRPEDVELPRVPLRRVLEDASDEMRAGARVELLDIIVHRRFSVVFQPVVDMTTGGVIGHEALCRGPGGTAFEAADYLFGSGHELDLAAELDHACRDTVLRGALALEPGTKLFLNILPATVAAGLVSAREILESIQAAGLLPTDVVLELSERVPLVHAEDLGRRLEPFREAGFPLAMDDIGAGYWSLRLVPEVEPAFLKIDRSLVTDLDQSTTKQDAVAAIIEMGRRHGGEVICEGIETQSELDEVIRLGARLGQGFLIAQPLSNPVREVAYRRRRA